jgi:hypothetical protein
MTYGRQLFNFVSAMMLFSAGAGGIIWLFLDGYGFQGLGKTSTMFIAMTVGGGLWLWYDFIRITSDNVEL